MAETWLNILREAYHRINVVSVDEGLSTDHHQFGLAAINTIFDTWVSMGITPDIVKNYTFPLTWDESDETFDSRWVIGSGSTKGLDTATPPHHILSVYFTQDEYTSRICEYQTLPNLISRGFYKREPTYYSYEIDEDGRLILWLDGAPVDKVLNLYILGWQRFTNVEDLSVTSQIKHDQRQAFSYALSRELMFYYQIEDASIIQRAEYLQNLIKNTPNYRKTQSAYRI